jgi:hypothetical protein
LESDSTHSKDGSAGAHRQPGGHVTPLESAPDSGSCQMFCQFGSPMKAAWLLLTGGRFYHGNTACEPMEPISARMCITYANPLWQCVKLRKSS